MKKAFIKSYGCQMNVYDSGRMADVVAEEGYAAAESAEDAADKATSSASSEDAASRPPRFVSRCRDIAERYGLTERETEVMISYAKGRSYARLQEELHASRGTVTTHLRHIYQKLDIHSKQELLDLIEGRVAPQEEGESKR